MKQLFYIFVFIFCFSCKEDAKPNPSHIEPVVKTKIEYTFPISTKDYSSVPKDTLIVSGKEIVFLMPSEAEFKLIKNEKGIKTRDSLFKYYSSKVKSFLKFPEAIKISFSTKRIIGIDEGNRIRYYDKLEYFKSNYAMLLMYNRTFSFVKEQPTEEAYFSTIDKYYRNNIRFEIPIKYKYVVSRNGLNIRTENGTVDGKFNNGDRVNILGYTEDVIEVEDQGKTIKGRWAIIQWNDNGRTKKRYVFEGFLGDIEDVKVFEDQVCTGFAFTQANRYGVNEADLECLTGYLDLKLISKPEFNALKSIKNNFLTTNPKVIIKENDDKTQNITLPIKDSLMVFKSKVGYNNSSHGYYGDIDFLNQYVMHHMYPKAEEQFYSFIDRTTGKETYTFSEIPYVSPDKKRIVSFVFDIYEEQFFIEIYNIKKDKTIVLERAFNFVHWLKTYQNEIKWISKKEFAIEIVNQNIWNGSEVKNPQYLKIKLKK